MLELLPYDIVDFNSPTTTLADYKLAIETRAQRREVILEAIVYYNNYIEEKEKPLNSSTIKVRDLVLVRDI